MIVGVRHFVGVTGSRSRLYLFVGSRKLQRIEMSLALFHMLSHSGVVLRNGLGGLLVRVPVVLNLASCPCHLVVDPLWMIFEGVVKEFGEIQVDTPRGGQTRLDSNWLEARK